MNITIDSVGKQTLNGDYQNNSQYVRVECKVEGSFPIMIGCLKIMINTTMQFM